VNPIAQNMGLEPLPDIDFNIRAGNTLVGFATLEEVRRVITQEEVKGKKEKGKGEEAAQFKLDLGDDLSRINEAAEIAGRQYIKFREMQTQQDMSPDDFSKSKKIVKQGLKKLADELNTYLAKDYAIDPSNKSEYQKWLMNCQPFHWFIEFHEILNSGGFDVIIGNPPYAELRSVKGYAIQRLNTISCKNLYPLVLERCASLAKNHGWTGFIVPISSISTDGYSELQKISFNRPAYFSSFDDRPSKLFEGLDHIQLTIHISQNKSMSSVKLNSTECYRWNASERSHLFSRIHYQSAKLTYLKNCLPKITKKIELSILDKLWSDKMTIGNQVSKHGENKVYFSRKVHNFLQVLDFVPEVYNGLGELRLPSELKTLNFDSQINSGIVFCTLNSTLFRWFINVFSDCRHVNKREVEGFHLDLASFTQKECKDWLKLSKRLSDNLKMTSEFRSMKFSHDHLRVQCIIPRYSKSILDEIDCALAQHYGFTDEELDFIINYDIKYRMGLDALEEDD